MKSTPSNLSNCKILQTKKKLKFGTKNALFQYFWARIFKKLVVMFEISTLKFLSILQNFAKKQLCLNLAPKMLHLGIFGIVFKKNIVIFEISTLEFSNNKISQGKQKCLNIGPKMSYFILGIFGL